MRALAELPADLLDGRLAASHEPEDSSSATRIARVAQLADRGDHQAAAREAADLIEARVYDVRLIGFYLFGLFLQRGIGYLPALLGRVSKLVAEDLGVLRPSRRKLQVVSSATAWLFENISARLLFHTKQRDATWEAWRTASDSALADAIAAGCTKVTLALEAVVDAPLAAVPLARVRRWTNDDLRRALARREAAAERATGVASAAVAASVKVTAERPEALPVLDESPGELPDELPDEPPDELAGEPPDELTGEADGFPDEPAGLVDEHAEVLAGERPDASPGSVPDLVGDPPAASPPASGRRVRSGMDRASSSDAAIVAGSPALAALQAKLRGFQALVARGELAKAAVVASDVRAVLAAFDPVAFFPSMFAAYFKALHQVVDELAPYFGGADDPSWHALDSYYRADMRGFFDD